MFEFIKKRIKRRKHFALIDAKIKSPLVRELLKAQYTKNL